MRKVQTCRPHPKPPDIIETGGDQLPSSLCVTIKPVPSLYVSTTPNFAMVNIASPLAPRKTASGIDCSGFSLPIWKTHFY